VQQSLHRRRFRPYPIVNEAVERAHRAGVLHAASLMVAGPAAADAVRRARTMPNLRVGLHLVVIEGTAVLPPAAIPDLVDAQGWLPSRQFRLGIYYAVRPRVRRQLAAEIRAQFAAFAATGLTLAHADAHKHMHLHPTVSRLMLDIGREFGLRRVRVPAEPPAVLARCGTGRARRPRSYHWTRVLRRRVRAAGMATSDHCFGIAWSGHTTGERVRRLLAELPDGKAKSTPSGHCPRRHAAAVDAHYEHEAELAALMALLPELERRTC
jgi:hopanoid biosynthesis associated protein HpnK